MHRFAVVLVLLSFIVVLPARAQTPGAEAGTKKLLAANGLYQRQLYKLAAEQYADFLKENPGHREARAAKYALAICYYRLNDFQKAAEKLEEVLGEGEFAQRDEAMLVLGFCRLSLKDYAKSIAVFDEVIAKFPDTPSAETAMLNRSQALLLSVRGKRRRRRLRRTSINIRRASGWRRRCIFWRFRSGRRTRMWTQRGR
jgi:FimV-like protein